MMKRLTGCKERSTGCAERSTGWTKVKFQQLYNGNIMCTTASIQKTVD